MTTQTEKKELQVAAHNDTVAKMSGVIDTAIKAAENLNLAAGAFKDVVFEQCLPEGLAADQVKTVRETDAAFVAAATKSWGEHSIAAMAKDKELAETSSKFGMLGGKAVEVTTYRQHEVSGGPGKDKVTVHGDTSVAIRDTSLKSDTIGFKPVREALRELGAKKLVK